MKVVDTKQLADLYQNLIRAVDDLGRWSVEAEMNRGARTSMFRAIDSLSNAQSEIFDALYELDPETAGGLAEAEDSHGR